MREGISSQPTGPVVLRLGRDGVSLLAEPVGSAAWSAPAPSRLAVAGVVDLRESRQLTRPFRPMSVSSVTSMFCPRMRPLPLPSLCEAWLAVRLPQGDQS